MSLKPLPIATKTSQPFWQALTESKVKMQQCGDCNEWVFYPRPNCSHCLSDNLVWQEISGKGTLYSYTIARVPTLPELMDELPQKMAVVQFEQGPRINTTLYGLQENEIEIGMALQPCFDHVPGEEVSMLRFTKIGGANEVEHQAEPELVTEVTAVEVTKYVYDDIEALQALVVDEYSEWSNQFIVSQDVINQFAALSGDDYWIHTDVEKSKQFSPFGGTIAQGALVQVLMSQLQIPLPYELTGFGNMINYGSDKLRFPSPVISGSKIHSRARVKSVVGSPNGTMLTLEMNIHVVGKERPSVINEMIIVYMK